LQFKLARGEDHIGKDLIRQDVIPTQYCGTIIPTEFFVVDFVRKYAQVVFAIVFIALRHGAVRKIVPPIIHAQVQPVLLADLPIDLSIEIKVIQVSLPFYPIALFVATCQVRHDQARKKKATAE
jgi:hypothetical protein